MNTGGTALVSPVIFLFMSGFLMRFPYCPILYKAIKISSLCSVCTIVKAVLLLLST